MVMDLFLESQHIYRNYILINQKLFELLEFVTKNI